MALHWNWELEVGYLCVHQEIDGEDRYFNIKIYEGNALAIFLYTFEDENGVERFDLYNFFADKEHFRNVCKDKSWDWARDITLACFYGDSIHNDMWLIIKDLAKKGKTIRIESKKPF